MPTGSTPTTSWKRSSTKSVVGDSTFGEIATTSINGGMFTAPELCNHMASDQMHSGLEKVFKTGEKGLYSTRMSRTGAKAL